MTIKQALLPLFCSTLIGCAAPKPVAGPTPLSEVPLAGTELPAGAPWPTPNWWQRYQDPTLDQLVTTALADSPTLAAARARYQSARESVRITAAATGAHVDAAAQSTRQRLSDNGLFPPEFLGFNWYNLTDVGISASYTFDWWGKQRASVEAATDEAHAAAADRAAAALVLASAVADTYFGWQADQARLALVEDRIAILTHADAIAAARLRAQIDAADEQTRVAADLAAAGEQQAGLRASAQLRRVALAALTGHALAQLPTLEARVLPVLPATVPERLHLDLLARRPDIAASRWRVEAAQGRRHVAAAQYYPDVSIKALLGLESMELNKLLLTESSNPMVGVAVHLPLFDNGLRAAQLSAADSEVNAAIATYNDAIISAAREVASNVIAGEQAAAERAQHLAQLQATTELQQTATARARQGLTDIRPALSAESAVLVQRDAVVQLDAAGLSADIALQRALGGGFQDSPGSAGLAYAP